MELNVGFTINQTAEIAASIQYGSMLRIFQVAQEPVYGNATVPQDNLTAGNCSEREKRFNKKAREHCNFADVRSSDDAVHQKRFPGRGQALPTSGACRQCVIILEWNKSVVILIHQSE